jgi:hypothetical protein
VIKDQTGGKLRTDAAATRRVALLASGAVLISLSPLAALAQQKKGPPPARSPPPTS